MRVISLHMLSIAILCMSAAMCQSKTMIKRESLMGEKCTNSAEAVTTYEEQGVCLGPQTLTVSDVDGVERHVSDSLYSMSNCNSTHYFVTYHSDSECTSSFSYTLSSKTTKMTMQASPTETCLWSGPYENFYRYTCDQSVSSYFTVTYRPSGCSGNVVRLTVVNPLDTCFYKTRASCDAAQNQITFTQYTDGTCNTVNTTKPAETHPLGECFVEPDYGEGVTFACAGLEGLEASDAHSFTRAAKRLATCVLLSVWLAQAGVA